MSLSTSLSIASQALFADTGALQTTNNNIANANTPGYTRETVVLQSAGPTAQGAINLGNGVVLEGFQSIRSEILQRQIQQQTQTQSGANAQLSTLQQVEPVFTTSTQDVGTTMSAFFSSISTLSTDPTGTPSRQAVLTAAQNLASAFNSASNTLTSTRSGLNSQVTQDIGQINQLTQEIAALNPQIVQLNASGQDAGTLQDQQSKLVLKLSALTSVAVTKTSDGDTLTTGNGTPLVVGSQSFALQTTTTSDGMLHVLSQTGQDITSTLTAGDLGGTIQSRDQTIPAILTQLNNLAQQFGSAVNAAQAQGFDQNGKIGSALFTLFASTSNAAATISVAITDPAVIAASSDGSSGSNGNLANLTAVQTTALQSGETPTDAYASLVYTVASLTSQANAESTATTSSLLQLNDQNSSVSGVSIDEESTNLIRYQQAYEAAARVISTVSSLFDITMSMGTNAAS
jgi:flagellar hook-associated protein 1 FlgK